MLAKLEHWFYAITMTGFMLFFYLSFLIPTLDAKETGSMLIISMAMYRITKIELDRKKP